MSVFDFVHLLHGARGVRARLTACMQVSVSMSVLSVFVLSVFVFSAFVCFFTALKVQCIR
jgi:hypothetical protein